ncbi:unnamed protein product [Somion occarium]|uniref:DUF7726 domain-containing protein n=1 Tax=Somion occarium TaxID=3059160 RepID=A0ABP1CK49_9APHY
MPPKRKSDAIDLSKDSEDENYTPKSPVTAPAKRARVSNASEVAPGNAEASSSKGKSDLESLKSAPKSWKDIELEGEDEGEVPVYDDCNEIRRKIRLLQKDPNFKITHWLKEIGDINSNSCQRFMKASGANGGASNGTYYAAYVTSPIAVVDWADSAVIVTCTLKRSAFSKAKRRRRNARGTRSSILEGSHFEPAGEFGFFHARGD